MQSWCRVDAKLMQSWCKLMQSWCRFGPIRENRQKEEVIVACWAGPRPFVHQNFSLGRAGLGRSRDGPGRCVCVYICRHDYVCVCMCMYVHIYIYVCTSVRVYVCMRVCMYACMYVCMYVGVCMCVYGYTCICVPIYVPVCMCTPLLGSSILATLACRPTQHLGWSEQPIASTRRHLLQ